MPLDVVFYSGPTGYTKRFVEQLGVPAERIPITGDVAQRSSSAAYILITPTYGGGGRSGGNVPKQVIRYLNIEANRVGLVGIVGGGNRSFGASFCRGAALVAAKCAVPLLHRFEVTGLPEDISSVRTLLETHS